jgi:anaerobic magnesium-protoporphyrin IX monomethyl ester cyclase
MKVLLVSVPGYHMGDEAVFPLGFGYLISCLREQGHEAKGIHFVRKSHVEQMLPKLIQSFDPDLIGFNCTTFTREAVRYWIPRVKVVSPRAKIVVGGVHASYLYHHVLNHYGADYVVIGEGEKTLPELCNALENKSGLEEVKGLSFKRDNVIVVTEKREFVEDLDSLPFPDYSFARGLIESVGMGWTITSRGCPARCKFCCTSNYWGQKVRMHSPMRVVEDLEKTISQFGVKRVFFHDDTFNLGVNRVLDICKGIVDRGLKIRWGVSCRATPATPEMIEAMVEAGCNHICWGVETASPKIMEWMNKRVTLDQIRHAYGLCEPYSRKGLLSTGAFMVVGLPGEDENSIQESANFLNTISLTDPPSCSIAYVLPGTQLWDEQRSVSESYWLENPGILYTCGIGGPEMGSLNRWASAVNQSGKIIPFDESKHFWYGILKGEVPDPRCPRELT